MAEHSTVNRAVAGSNPAGGATQSPGSKALGFLFLKPHRVADSDGNLKDPSTLTTGC